MMKNFYLTLLLGVCLQAACSQLTTDEEDPVQQNGERKGSLRVGSGKGEGAGSAQNSSVRGRGLGKGATGRGRRQAQQGHNAVALTRGEKEAIEIETVEASLRSLRTLHSAMGKVLAPQTRMAIVSYAFPARVSGIHVKIGDWVQEGQPLLTLQSEEVGLARSEYHKAIADLELAKTNCEREKRLYDRGVGAHKNLLSAEAELKVAEANLDAAEKKLHVLGFSEEEVRAISVTHQVSPVIQLFAPIGGKIVQHNAVLGSMIDQTSELLTIMDPSVLWVDAQIFERDIAKIRIGQRVEVTVPAYPGEKFAGKVSYISDTLDETTRTITVRTEVENRSWKLKPGMFADIRIFLNHRTRVTVLPCEAILDDSGEQIVFVEREGQYVRQVVQRGSKDDGYCEIQDGIEEGERVITTGNYQLKSKFYDELLDRSHVH